MCACETTIVALIRTNRSVQMERKTGFSARPSSRAKVDCKNVLAAAAEEAAAKLRARSDQDKETRVVPANGGQCGPQPMCPVCWETPTDPVRLQCDHELCKACMRRWAQGGGKGPGLGAGAKCPVCRKVSNRRRLWEDPDDRRPKRRHTNAASAAPGGSRATCVHAPVAMQGPAAAR